MDRPLQGIRVLDLSRVLAGPYCTMFLGDMGADVVKIERPGVGDDTRGYGPPFINGESAYFLSVNRNKRSMVLNLKHERGKEILRRMVETADVLVENFRPGTMEKLGFDYESARVINPRLVYCSISGYGHTGPDAALPGYDLIIQGEGGIASLTGDAEGPPYKVGTSQADIIAGMVGFQGILIALLTRSWTGVGQKVDIALLDVQVALLTYQAGIYFATGQSPSRMGNQHPTIAPYETYLCRDGYLNLACGNDRIWQRFCELAELENLVSDERFQTNADRVRNRTQLNGILTDVMLQRTTQEWVDLLRPRGVPCGRIRSVDEVCEHPQVLAREMVLALEHAAAGTIRLTGTPIKLSGTPGGVDRAPPVLGQHTGEILQDWLAMTPVETAALRQAGAFDDG